MAPGIDPHRYVYPAPKRPYFSSPVDLELTHHCLYTHSTEGGVTERSRSTSPCDESKIDVLARPLQRHEAMHGVLATAESFPLRSSLKHSQPPSPLLLHSSRSEKVVGKDVALHTFPPYPLPVLFLSLPLSPPGFPRGAEIYLLFILFLDIPHFLDIEDSFNDIRI